MPAVPTVQVPVPPDRVVRDPGRLRWGIVSTIRAPLRDIARFAAYHLDLGAGRITIYLDRPDPQVAEFFAPHRQVEIIQCDDGYWRNKPGKARSSHQLRQAFNASRSYRRSRLDWLAHIDVDEFVLTERPLAGLLAQVPADAALARLRPAELLAQPDPWQGPAQFKLTRRERGLPKSVLSEIYPEFGAYLPEGFLGYTGGKNIARTGLPDIRLGIHALWQNGAKVANGHPLSNVHVGHAHAPSWEVFQRHFAFRMAHGSYRKDAKDSMQLRDVLDVLTASEGQPGLRRFYDRVNAATPGLLDRLKAYDMLLTARLDLDDKVTRWFGDLPMSPSQQRRDA